MKRSNPHRARTWTFAIAVVIGFGCTGGGSEDPPEIRDGGPRDGGETRDGGEDGGPVCGDGICDTAGGEDSINCTVDCFIDRCPDGTEGCECNSTFAQGDQEFLQDDCDVGLLCVPWDTISGRNDLTGPLQSCVKPCELDADCGQGRACVESFGFGDGTGAGRICVDRVAQQDEYCGTTKLVTPRVAQATVRTPEEQVGCGPESQCAFGILGDLNIDEGVCLQFCGQPGLAPCGGETPYCNPNLLTTTATDGTQLPLGVCSKAQLGVGSWCRPDEPNSPTITQICDTSDDTVGDVRCINFGLPYGLCMEVCDTRTNPPATPCEGTDADQGGDLYCVNDLLQGGGGLCMSPNCSNTPDTCAGPGAESNGRFCFTATEAGDGLCVDRRGDPLSPGALNSDGLLTTEGDDCRADEMGFTECPDNTFCVGAQGGGGACVIGCAQNGGAAYCSGALADLGQGADNATCAPVLVDTTLGLCGGD